MNDIVVEKTREPDRDDAKGRMRAYTVGIITLQRKAEREKGETRA